MQTDIGNGDNMGRAVIGLLVLAEVFVAVIALGDMLVRGGGLAIGRGLAAPIILVLGLILGLGAAWIVNRVLILLHVRI